MNSKQQRTLEKIFATPTRADIAWNDIESLFGAAGGTVLQAAGSRIRVDLNGVTAVFHTPHLQRQTPKVTIKCVRGFLEQAGVMP